MSPMFRQMGGKCIGRKHRLNLWLDQPKIFHAFKDDFKTHVHLTTRQRSAQAVVYAFTKGNVLFEVGSGDIKLHGIREARVILVC